MAVTYVTLYPPGSTQPVQVVEGSPLHLIYAEMGFSAIPYTPGPPKRPDPFPQYVHDDEVQALLAEAAVPATDPVVAALLGDGGSQTRAALDALDLGGDPITPEAVAANLPARLSDAALRAAFVRRAFAAQNPTAARPWITKALGRATAKATVVAIGDSITEGQGATAIGNRYVAKARDGLRTRYPTAAAGGSGWISADYDQTSFPDVVTASGSLTRNNDFGIGRKVMGLNAGATLTFTITGTQFDLFYVRGNGVLGVKIDGGTVTNVDTAGAFGDGFKWTSPTLTAGAHTVVLSYVSGSAPYVSGLWVYNGDASSGIHVLDSGHYGWSTIDWSTNTGATNWRDAIAAAAPDLVTIFLGVNDCIFGIAPATTAADLQAVIAAIRTATSNSSLPFVLIAPYQPSSANQIGPYVQAIRDVAAADGNAGCLDLSLLMAGSNDNSGGLLTDLVHPSDAGHAFIGAALADYLAA